MDNIAAAVQRICVTCKRRYGPRKMASNGIRLDSNAGLKICEFIQIKKKLNVCINGHKYIIAQIIRDQ